MSSNSQEPAANLFGKLASLVFLLAGGLYFTGWVYRWVYFGLFQVQVTSLDLPLESFYLAAFQALFGHPFAIIKTLVVAIIFAIAVHLTLWIIDRLLTGIIQPILHSMRSRLLGRNERRSTSNWFAKQLRSLANFNSLKLDSIQFLRSLIDELVIIFWFLAALLFLARQQAYFHAWTDAINETSTLPVVTLVAAEENISLGRNSGNGRNPTGFRIIGDEKRYLNFFGRELTEIGSSEGDRVWRLLINRNGYFYIFPALPSQKFNSPPPVVLIHEGSNGDRLVILSPKVSP